MSGRNIFLNGAYGECYNKLDNSRSEHVLLPKEDMWANLTIPYIIFITVAI